MLLVSLAVASSTGFSQGVLNFANFGNGAYAPVYDTGGTTKLAGTNYSADLYWANGIVMDSCALQPLQAPAFFSSVPSEAGFFFGGPRTIPAAAGSTITAQIRVWPTAAGSSWLDAGCALGGGHIGASALFLATLAAPPDAAGLTNLNSFGLQVYILTPLVWVEYLGVSSNQIGFRLDPNSLIPVVVVEASTNLTVWSAVQTYTCVACPVYFRDPLPTNNPVKFYRVGWHR